jgi:DNA uptake protein ComE-like DNA-binding protein
MVLWIVGVAVVMLAVAESAAYRQAASARAALGQVRARWAARAGLESAIAVVEYATQNPDQFNAYAVFDEIADAGQGELAGGAAYRLSYTSARGEVVGALDAHAKLNVNLLTAEDLILLPMMTEDIADAILDWVDSDEDTRPLGAEDAYYLSAPYPYNTRNAPFRSIAELELVAGVTPEMVRGEDWNLNGRLDPNEDDGNATWPPDNADGKLDTGWSGILTASSVDGGVGASGQARLDLTTATSEQVAQRLGVDSTQADAILDHGQQSGATLADYIRSDLSRLVTATGGTTAAPAPLTTDEVAKLLDECTIGAPTGMAPGKLNINTCEAETLEYLSGLDPAVADSIVSERAARTDGFTSVMDLLDVPGMTRNRLSRISAFLDVRSNAVVVSSRGRDSSTGAETEIVAVIDRTTIPVILTELRTP